MLRAPLRLCLLLLPLSACAPPADGPTPAHPTPTPTPEVPPAEPGLVAELLLEPPRLPDLSGPQTKKPPKPKGDPCPAALPTDGSLLVDVAACAGIDYVSAAYTESHGAGPAFADSDGDGDLDLYLVTTDGPNLLLAQTAGVFAADPRHESAANPAGESNGATWVDFDNDGDQDLYVINRGPNALLRNDGDTFVDVAATLGVDEPGHGMGAAWADFDGDGWLDLYVTNWTCHECDWLVGNDKEDRLYRGSASGAFTDVSTWLGPDYLRYGPGFGAIWFDVDDDGDLDLYVANDKGTWEPDDPDGQYLTRNALFLNDGPGCGGHCFSEVARDVGADLRIFSMGVTVGDYDNDGDQDLAVTDGAPPKLLQNIGGSFVEVGLASGLDSIETVEGWGIEFADFDNDGWLDLYWVDGPGHFSQPNRLALNQGDGTFVDATDVSGGLASGESLGVAVGDYDADGWIDVAVGSKSLVPYALLRNVAFDGSTAGWTTVQLVGGGGIPADPLGTRMTIDLSDGRTLTAELRQGSSFGSGSESVLHFGFGSAEPVAGSVRWPDGTVQPLGVIPRNERWVLQYGE